MKKWIFLSSLLLSTFAAKAETKLGRDETAQVRLALYSIDSSLQDALKTSPTNSTGKVTISKSLTFNLSGKILLVALKSLDSDASSIPSIEVGLYIVGDGTSSAIKTYVADLDEATQKAFTVVNSGTHRWEGAANLIAKDIGDFMDSLSVKKSPIAENQ